ncbi:ABC transporter ATP-binding protein [Ramlibacter sp.]|uniref:ABC transporter ATP-binding protein n=1 Tax=Ramlibacter sp. TaxID=1917967 RepID=UPI003D11589C
MSGENAAVSVRGVAKHFGKSVAVHEVSFDIAPGEFVSLLGPSGCGKTTTLRMIAGLEDATAGDIRIDGVRVNDVPIHKRNIGMVFQNLALFPHKTVRDNVAYGLQFRSVSREQVKARVDAALAMVKLPHLADRFPSQLSGGQQQRVAIARAIVIEPSLLLLDEPLSALDAGLREEMRGELRRIQRALKIPTLFVTHDQAEALSMSDKVIVMNAGRMEQEGTPHAIFSAPASAFVAQFFGDVNEIAGRASGEAGTSTIADAESGRLFAVRSPGMAGMAGNDADVHARIRADRLSLRPGAAPDAIDGVDWHPGTIIAAEYLGVLAKYTVQVGKKEFRVMEPLAGAQCHPLGTSVHVGFPTAGWVVDGGLR